MLAACGPGSPFPDMEPGETGRVVNVIDGDALVLDTGQSVRLVSIEAPALYPRERPADIYAAESARLLEDLALGRKVQLFYPGITRDRYDRALAHVVTIDGSGPKTWLNRAMIENGGAWVRLYPDTAARGDELMDLEKTARGARRGLWSMSRYEVRDATTFTAEDQGFHVVRARLGIALNIPLDTKYPPACLRELTGSSLLVSVRRNAKTVCGLANDTSVFVRGYVSGLEIDLTYPRHLEVIISD